MKTSRALLSEFLGSAILAATVVGSGIAAEQLSPHQVGLELLENSLATAGILYVLITLLGPVSGAHFNPVVSFVDAALHTRNWWRAFSYLPFQVAGCSAGALLANAMFALPLGEISTHHRASTPHLLAEVVATAGLILVIFGLARVGRAAATAAAVASYIGAAYFFTSSTSVANPAIAVGRMFSNSFAGIAPASVPGFVAMEIVGGLLGLGLVSFLFTDHE